MAKKKQRKKGHSLNKRYNRVAQATFKNHIIAFATNQEAKETHLIKMPGARIVKPTLFEAKTLTENPYYWTIYLVGFGRKENGTEYMEYEVIRTHAPYLQRELVGYLNERHQAFLKTMNKSRIVGAGWIASMADAELTDDQMFEVFHALNAWGD